MRIKRILSLALVLCLLCAALSPAAQAAEPPALDDFIDRYGPLLGDGLDALTDWLEGQTSSIAPELRETLRGIDTNALFSDLKALMGETSGMSDEELRAAVLALAEKHGVHLVDSQVEQLMGLCRTMEKLDPGQLRERIDALQQEFDVPGGLRGAWQSVVEAFKSAGNWIAEKLGGLFR